MINTYLYKKKAAPSKSRNQIIIKVVSYVLLAILALFVLVPFYIIIITSLKTSGEALSPSFSWFPKEGVHFTAYYDALFNDVSVGGEGGSLLRGFLNTLIVVLPPTILGLLFSSVAAYAFAKLKFPGKNVLFSFLLFTMMVPSIITLTPTFLIYQEIGWYGTYAPLMIPGMFGAAACVFFMRQFFSGVPTDLVEAAKIDGMNHLQIFFVIMIPLSKAALISQGILGFIGGYNDYFGPMLYLTNPEMFTLQIALNQFIGTNPEWPIIMAACVIALVPTLIIYFFAQNYFVKGIAMSGLKG